MQNAQEYLDKLSRLSHAGISAASPHGTGKQAGRDTLESNSREFASANLHHLLPELPWQAHPKIIDEVLLHQLMAELDETSMFLMANTEIVDPHQVLTSVMNEPVIFAAFHFGSFRLITMLLMSRNLNCMMPADNEFYAEQNIYQEHRREIQAYFNSHSQFTVINAEEPTSALAMARKAKAGWSLLAYADGNTGVQGKTRRDDKLLKVPLLGRQIYARKGIAFLSHHLQLPIIPVFCEITGQLQRRMTFLGQIVPPDMKNDRDSYCQAATEKLYALLGDYIKQSPSQWRGWLDMQRYLDLDAPIPLESVSTSGQAMPPAEDVVVARRLVFNRERFGFIVRDGERMLLDKLTYDLLSIPESVSAVLESCREPVTVSDYLPDGYKETIEQLLSLKLLSPVAESAAVRST